MTHRWKPSVTVAAIIEQNGKFLLVEEHTPEGLMLNNPAGHLELGESLQEACARETLEETAYTFIPKYLLGVYISRFKRNQVKPLKPLSTIIPASSYTPAKDENIEDITYLRFAFCGTLGPFNSELKLDEGIVRTLWLDINEIRGSSAVHRSPLLLACAEDYMNGKRFDLNTLHTDPSIYTPPIRT